MVLRESDCTFTRLRNYDATAADVSDAGLPWENYNVLKMDYKRLYFSPCVVKQLFQ